MKRSIFVATLALTPALLHAQAAVSAQNGSLQARITPPAALKAAAPKDTAPTTRISTGIVAPRQLQPFNLNTPASHTLRVTGHDVTVVVTMMVDAAGKPDQIAISQSGGEVLDKEVLDAMRQYSFVPGTLDGQNFALPVRLSIIIPLGTQY